MSKIYEDPTEAMDGTRVTHPSFGAATMSRVTGLTHLVGSDVQEHSTWIRVRVSRASIYRDNDSERHMPNTSDQIVEFDLSEAQLARWIMSGGSYSGTLCTLKYVHGAQMAEAPATRPRYARLVDGQKDALSEHAGRVQTARERVVEKIQNSRLSQRAKKDMLRDINQLGTHITGHLRFTEKILNEAGTEYVTAVAQAGEAERDAVLRNLGLDVLRAELTRRLDSGEPVDGVRHLLGESSDSPEEG